MFKNPQAMALIEAAERILPLTQIQSPGEARTTAVDIIGDLYKIAEEIETRDGLQTTALALSSAAQVAAKQLASASKAAKGSKSATATKGKPKTPASAVAKAKTVQKQPKIGKNAA